jgi:hypothetical protein
MLNNLCVGVSKALDNEIVEFGAPKIFFLVIFSELLVKCSIRFTKFVKILIDQWKC